MDGNQYSFSILVETTSTMESLTTVRASSWDVIMKSVCAKLHFWSITEWKKNVTIRKKADAPVMQFTNQVFNFSTSELDQTCSLSSREPMAYPNCDLAIWLRTCEKEIIEPLNGVTTGIVPSWIHGSLFRNGPGKQKYGRQTVNHLFDASGLLHLFRIRNGKVTYQTRYVKSKSYTRNTAAEQLVVPEFTTPAAPDLCRTIFHKISSLFVLDRIVSDNAMISVYPLGDELYAFAEAPFIHRIDPVTLETIGRENLNDRLQVINQSSHPHVAENGEAFQLGQIIGAAGPSYVIIHYPSTENPISGKRITSAIKSARIVSRIPCSSLKEPSYMHSFSITKSFFVLVEQPLSVSLKKVVGSLISGKPLVRALKWRQKMTRIRLIYRETGMEVPIKYLANAFFYLHTVNAFESDDDHLIIDICCYENAKMLDCMYIEALQSAQSDPNYASLFRGRPKRFVLPLKPKQGVTVNLNSYSYSLSEAYWKDNKETSIFITPDELCPLGCETPQVNYGSYNGKPYRFFYAISSDVDAENPGTLIKVDTIEKKYWTWAEKNVYASEPIFVSHPEAESEDDGVLLSSLIWGGANERRIGLLVLDASTLKEIARTEFVAPSPVPKCLHGYFSTTK